jgi:hypothetical protein
MEEKVVAKMNIERLPEPPNSSGHNGILLGSSILSVLAPWVDDPQNAHASIADIHDVRHFIQLLEGKLFLSQKLWQNEMGDINRIEDLETRLCRSFTIIYDLSEEDVWENPLDEQQIIHLTVDLCLNEQLMFATIDDPIPLDFAFAGVETISPEGLIKAQHELEAIFESELNILIENARPLVLLRPVSLELFSWLIIIQLILAVLNDESLELLLEQAIRTSPFECLRSRQPVMTTVHPVDRKNSIGAVNQIADLYQDIVGLLQTIANQAMEGDRNSLIGKLAIQAVVAAIVTTPKIALANELLGKDNLSLSFGKESQKNSGYLRFLEQDSTSFAMVSTLTNDRSATIPVQNLFQQVLRNGLASNFLIQQTKLVDVHSFAVDLEYVAMTALDTIAQSIDEFISDPLKRRSWENLLNSGPSKGVFNAGLEEAVVQESRTSVPELESIAPQIAEPIITVTETIATVNEPVIEPVVDVVTEPIVSIIPNPADPSPNPISQIIDNGAAIWSTFESGVYKVDTQGQITIDYLWDGGANEGEVGIFALSGMESLLNNSTAFTQEAIRRVVSNSRLGHIVISDSTEGARFSGKLVSEPEEFNFGPYSGSKSFAMESGSQFGVVVISQGQFRTADLSRSDGFFFSLSQTGGNTFLRNEQMIWQADNRSILRVEDISINNPISDRDYNDIILQVTGANGITQGRQLQRSDLFSPNQIIASNRLDPR